MADIIRPLDEILCLCSSTPTQ